MVGRQFRIGLNTPIYTIAQVDSATSLQLQFPYGGADASAVTYKIFLCYVTPPPDDFHQLISVWDPNYNWQLMLNVSQGELNSVDAQRANTGQSYLLANYDYSQDSTGTVQAPIQIIGSGDSPSVSDSSSYTGPANAIFTVQITTGGASGTAVFKWEKNAEGFTTGVTTDSGGAAQALQDGVSIYFPTGQTYVVGDTWIIRTSVTNSPGMPRYEIWPQNYSNYCYPFLYEARCQDLNEPGAVLPRFIRGDVVMDLALSMAAKWPGPSVDDPNPYYDLNLADRMEKGALWQIGELERQDDEVFQESVSYAPSMQFAPFADARFIQSHALLI